MGTYYTNGTGNMTWKDFIFSEIDTPSHKILQCSIKGSVAYLACKVEKTGQVYGLVLLLETHGGNKGYKPMEETMGPYYYQAPKSLIAKLSPTTDENSLQWRKSCLEFANKRKVKEGDRIKLKSPISFLFCGRRYNSDTFLVKRLKGVRGLVFETEDGGLVKLSKIDNREKTFI